MYCKIIKGIVCRNDVTLANVENGENVDWIDEEELDLGGMFLPIKKNVNLETNRFLVRSIMGVAYFVYCNNNHEENHSVTNTLDFKTLSFFLDLLKL